MTEMMSLDDIVAALKNQYSLIQVGTSPELYQPPHSTKPEFSYVPGRLEISFSPEQSALVTDGPGRNSVYFHNANALANDLHRIPQTFPLLKKSAREAAQRNCDVLEVEMPTETAYCLLGEYIDHYAAASNS